jgi:hypothetical protein
VSVRLADGTRETERFDASLPEADLARQEAQLIDKASALLEPRMPAVAREQLVRRVLALDEEADMAQFMARTHAPR